MKPKWPLIRRMMPEYGIEIDGVFISLALLEEIGRVTSPNVPLFITDSTLASVLYEHRLTEKGHEEGSYYCGELLPGLLREYSSSDPALASAEQLFTELEELHIEAGTPSSRDIATAIGSVSHTTVNKALRGHVIPTWPTLRKIVDALDGDTEKFRKLWLEADREKFAGR